ncbi:MAG: hypothetical protein SOW47_13570 [Clostridium perfringens]|nr:hypothetical protein [Clostridium perfringens]
MGDLEEFLKNKKLFDKYNKELQEFEIKKNKMTEKIDIEKFFEVMTEITQAASKMFIFECVYKLEQLLNDGIELIDLKKDSDLGIFNYSMEQDDIILKKEDKFNSNIPFDLFLKDANTFELLNDNPTINVLELQKYFYRLIEKGHYKRKYYKEKAFKKIFKGNSQENVLAPTEYKYRDTLTSDYSDRMNCLLKVLKQSGTKDKPAVINKNGYSIYKIGGALDDSDIELFHYLIGELEEHKCETDIKFKKSDFINNIGYSSKRGSKLDNLTLSLMNLNTQSIAISDERNDTVGKKLAKKDYKKIKGKQLIVAEFESNEDSLYIKLTSPFSKYFREQEQFGRLLDRKIISKFLYSNPRVLKIARELSRMLYISEQSTKSRTNKIEINYDTLIKNIGESNLYKNYSNKRVYLKRLTKDIEKAYTYIHQEKLTSNINKKIIEPTPSTLKNGKIQLIKSY